jgi:hypothetical protein
MHLNEYLSVVSTQRADTLGGQESSEVFELRVYYLERMATSYLYGIYLASNHFYQKENTKSNNLIEPLVTVIAPQS